MKLIFFGLFILSSFVSQAKAAKKKRIPQCQSIGLKDCSYQVEFYKTYSSEDKSKTIFIVNACQEDFVKKLKFIEIELNNYGSMEAGKILSWSDLQICPQE